MFQESKNIELIENFVFNAEKELSNIFLARSLQTYQKVKNILRIFQTYLEKWIY